MGDEVEVDLERPVTGGTSDVVSPRADTYSGTFHQWFVSGVDAMRTLPTTWVHSCSVSRVALHSATGNGGHGPVSFTSITPCCLDPALVRVVR